jgi:flagellar basal-body rod modification protein FlgD
MDNIESNSLVGKYAVLNVDGKEVSGRIDFVTKDDEKGLMVSIEGKLYEKSKIVSVVDETYYTAVSLASLLTDEIAKLPKPDQVTRLDGEQIGRASAYYNSMDGYQLGFVDEEGLKKYLAVVEQYEKLMKNVENADNNSEAPSNGGEEAEEVEGA